MLSGLDVFDHDQFRAIVLRLLLHRLGQGEHQPDGVSV
jgi:hypothetical protein